MSIQIDHPEAPLNHEIGSVERLAAAGRHADVIEHLHHSSLAHAALQSPPQLALLYGSAYARLARHAEGDRWGSIASHRAWVQGDRELAAKASHLRGTIAYDTGRIEDAVGYFLKAVVDAQRNGDGRVMGRCCAQLGDVARLRGHHAKAVESFEGALSHFGAAGDHDGIVDAHCRLATTFRDQGDLDRALEAAECAVHAAVGIEDRGLAAQVLAQRGEIRALRGEVDGARRDIETALDTHRDLHDRVAEAEDLRILATLFFAEGKSRDAELLLEEVIERARECRRPMLAAYAARDLATLLAASGRRSEALNAARSAMVLFTRLGARIERSKLQAKKREWR